jgi:hypothetical protein
MDRNIVELLDTPRQAGSAVGTIEGYAGSARRIERFIGVVVWMGLIAVLLLESI